MAEFYLNPVSESYGEYIKQKLLKKSAVAESGCVLWTGYVERDGYGTTKVKSHFDGRRFTLTVHRMHVSHICHQKLCLNVSHLSYEPPAVNLQRTSCVREGRCTGHGTYKECILRQ
ncbi:hypothetical protein Bbelb_277540 [Branchiostoma belcheri]|nr:hypothetical protein Bbelb_277540 [Branchiostoma belcheri]